MSLLQDKPKKMNTYQKKELEKKQARRRHLQRAKAGIDLSQRQDKDMLFKTTSREQAIKTYIFEPEGPDMGKYNPKIIEKRQPCYVRI